ncbi:MAG: nicotinate-nucleotide adenylyltransferase [Halioglobus sp.]
MSDNAIAGGPVAVFGGTFDPVHHGHLRSGVELAERLQFAEVRMMPCGSPPHRESPERSAMHRAAMLELAVAPDPMLHCDRRELLRGGRSYTVDSLIELRQELGEKRSICLVMGCDAVLDITSWHRWEELLHLAHVVVIARPGWQIPESGPVAQWMRSNSTTGAQQLSALSAGTVHVEELRPFAVSASEIRKLLAAGKSARYLLPESVLEYISNHELYTH